jgi:hypothetical protein
MYQAAVAHGALDRGRVYGALWDRLESQASAKSGWTGDQFLERFKTKEDFPDSIDTHLTLLGQAGFTSTCLHLHLDRTVFVGRRPLASHSSG